MKEDRIDFRDFKYYSFIDMQEQIDQILSEYESESFNNDVNNILELYNVLKYIDTLSTNIMPEEKISIYKSHIKNINRIVGVYFSKITNDNFDSFADKLEYCYVSVFWSIMCNNKRISEISDNKFKVYIEKNSSHITRILEQKELAIKFSKIIYEQLTKRPKIISQIISYFLELHTQQPTKMYITEAFSSEELNTLFLIYINSDAPHINMLTLIRKSNNDSQIGLTDEIRLLAKRKEEELGEKLFENGGGIQHSIEITFGDFNTQKKCEYTGEKISVSYDRKEIYENLDYPSLMNLFIYFFDFVDNQFRSEFPIMRSDHGEIVDAISIKGKNSYNTAYTYGTKRIIYHLTTLGFLKEIHAENIEIEKIFKWFFEEYLATEFEAYGFFFNAPSPGTSYLEKCRTLATEIDAVLKQYNLYCRYGEIDKELYTMSSGHMFFSEIPSMNDKKYIYANSDKIKWCMYHLYGNVLMHHTKSGIYRDCENLAQMFVLYGSIKKEEFNRYSHQKPIEELLSMGIIYEKNNAIFLNKEKAFILRNLYDKEVLCYNYFNKTKHIIDEWIDTNDLCESKTLFSKPEQNYLDYMLNKATFSDGFELRNKYLHGTTLPDERVNKNDYVELINIMILIIIKINEEFCLKFPLKNR